MVSENEKIIKGLDQLYFYLRGQMEDMTGTVYGDRCADWITTVIDASRALRENEPHLLTVEEVTELGKKEANASAKLLDYVPVWIEDTPTVPPQIVVLDKLGDTIWASRIGTRCTEWYKVNDYGKTWRCWSAKPTKEQREAAKWND